MSDTPTGADLVHQLWTAARAAHVSLNDFVGPLSSQPGKFIRQLDLAARPGAMTVQRVRALIAGEAIPSLASRRHLAPAAGAAVGELLRERIEQRRSIAEAAGARRLPGETLHAAVQRIEQELRA